MKIIADKAIPFLRGVLEPYATVVYLPGREITPESVRTADALLIRTRTRCDERLLAGSSVRMIATATIGFDHIDTAYCRRDGITVETAAGCNARGVLQYVAAALAALSRREGWHPTEKTLGIVGAGHVGSLVEAYARSWGFRTVVCDPPREEREHCGFRTLAQVVHEADLLTFHTPLDPTTRHMADRRLLAATKPGCTIINSSRGEVIDTEALRGCGRPYILDVWEHEPEIDRALLAGALFASPHIAGYSLQGKANATALAVRAVARSFGLPLAEWFPEGVRPSQPRPIGWEEMTATIARHCDLEAETRRLKSAPEQFEAIRNEYAYREEYF
ncbi:MAG: 4-phosphoerythronate dehydrogenase [Alistipes sp.]|nr:4-phosphoerythronate dehydrogenase [Alistipes sp.]